MEVYLLEYKESQEKRLKKIKKPPTQAVPKRRQIQHKIIEKPSNSINHTTHAYVNNEDKQIYENLLNKLNSDKENDESWNRLLEVIQESFPDEYRNLAQLMYKRRRDENLNYISNKSADNFLTYMTEKGVRAFHEMPLCCQHNQYTEEHPETLQLQRKTSLEIYDSSKGNQFNFDNLMRMKEEADVEARKTPSPPPELTTPQL